MATPPHFEQLTDGNHDLRNDRLVEEIIAHKNGDPCVPGLDPSTNIQTLTIGEVIIARLRQAGQITEQAHDLRPADSTTATDKAEQGSRNNATGAHQQYQRAERHAMTTCVSSPTARSTTRNQSHEVKTIVHPSVLSSKVARTSHRPGRKYEMRWRLGPAPGAVMKETQEQRN